MRIHTLAVTVLLALTAGACCPPFCLDSGGDGGGGQIVWVVFESLKPGTVPVALEEDEDTKDIAIKDRKTFKPSKGSDTGLAKRFCLRAKRDGATGMMEFERTATGDMTSWVRVAVDPDKLTGLENGTACLVFERRPEPGTEGPVLTLEALYNPAIAGFTCQAREDGVLAGIDADFPGTTELFLKFDDLGGLLELEASIPNGDTWGDTGDPIVLHSIVDTIEKGAEHGLAFGAKGLDKKAQVYFTQLTLQSSNSATAGPAEMQMANLLGEALINLHYAQASIQFNPEQSWTLAPTFGWANQLIYQAWEMTQENEFDGIAEFADDTNTKLLFKNTHKANWKSGILAAKGLDIFDQQGSMAPLQGTLKQTIAACETAIGICMGYGKGSSKKLNKSADVYY